MYILISIGITSYIVGFIIALKVNRRGAVTAVYILAVLILSILLLILLSLLSGSQGGGSSEYGGFGYGLVYLGGQLWTAFLGAPALGYLTGRTFLTISNSKKENASDERLKTWLTYLLAAWPLIGLVGILVTEPVRERKHLEEQVIAKEKDDLIRANKARAEKLYEQVYEMQFGGRTVFLSPKKYYRLNGVYGVKGASEFLEFLEEQDWPDSQLSIHELSILFYEKGLKEICSSNFLGPEAHYCLPHIDYSLVLLATVISSETLQIGTMAGVKINDPVVRRLGNLDILHEKPKYKNTTEITYKMEGHAALDPFLFRCESDLKNRLKLSCKIRYRIDTNTALHFALNTTEENLERDISDFILATKNYWNALQIKR